MKEKIKSVYYCEHCGKHGLRKHLILYHESLCNKNPDNKRPCKECKHLTKKTTTAIISCVDILTDEFHVNDYDVTLYFCKEKNVFLFSPQDEIKGNQYQIEEQNLPMPKECDLYEPLPRLNPDEYVEIDF